MAKSFDALHNGRHKPAGFVGRNQIVGMLGSPKVTAIYRYPVKGLSPEPLGDTLLTPSETVPGDRLYAIENGPSGFDRQAPRHQPKTRYLMLMKNERLATLRARFDHASHTLTVESDGRAAA